jgi:tetratricopeptide (TPR) repeat protein
MRTDPYKIILRYYVGLSSDSASPGCDEATPSDRIPMVIGKILKRIFSSGVTVEVAGYSVRDLSIGLERVGALLSVEKDFEGALDKDLEPLAIRKKLAIRDESNVDWQNDLSWSYIALGDLFSAKNDTGGALANYQKAQTIERTLVKRDSKTLQLQSDLTVTCQKMGDVYRQQRNFSGALNSYRECVALGENLVAKDPTNGEWASELALACYSRSR